MTPPSSNSTLHPVEDAHVVPHRVVQIHLARHCDLHGAQRQLLLAREDLQELDAAGRDSGEEDLAGRDRLTRAAVLHRAVDDEVLVARAAEHAPEDVRRAGVDLVAADVRGARHRVGV